MVLLKPVLIKWKDISASDSGWHSQDEFDEYVSNEDENTVIHAAFLIERDENQVVFVDSWIDKGKDIQYGTIHKIPAGCIVEIKELT